MAFVEIQTVNVDDCVGITNDIPESIVKEHRIFPLRRRGNTLFVATADIKDLSFVDTVTYILDCEVYFVLCDIDSIEAAIQRVYG